ncbi:hypothetical protein GCM10009754_81640 [Amycolatopsis minnesotensis]|uniref:Deazaflavin-dependent oxidoreductase (Nitroreductase family) n=1 Tax=Amycolatopsis minnesotensis TaxID=337894 RepID=A0ABP5E4P3_9PSEU
MTALLDGEPQPFVDGGTALRVLEAAGRHSGRPYRTPLGVLTLDGGRYLVSPDANRDWVRNLTANPACGLRAGEVRERLRARRIGGDEAAAAVSAYLSAVRVPWAPAAFPVTPAASTAEIVANLDALAVFRLDAEPGDRS